MPVHGGGTNSAPCSPFRRKTAICARVTEAFRQYAPPPQPAVMPCRKTFSTSEWKMSSCSTSLKSASQPCAMEAESSGSSGLAPAFSTATSLRLPAPSGGAEASISVSPMTTTLSAITPPIVREAPGRKPLPITATDVPPEAGPDAGKIDSTWRGGVEVGVGVEEALGVGVEEALGVGVGVFVGAGDPLGVGVGVASEVVMRPI